MILLIAQIGAVQKCKTHKCKSYKNIWNRRLFSPRGLAERSFRTRLPKYGFLIEKSTISWKKNLWLVHFIMNSAKITKNRPEMDREITQR